MIRRLSLALCLAALAPLLAFGRPPEPQPLHRGEWLSGRFVQERHLAGLAAPLHSEGHFLLAAGKGLVWHSEKPFDTAVVMTEAGLLQLVNGQESQRLPATRMPFLAQLYDMLGAALGGDWSALARTFSIQRQTRASGWTITLTPLRHGDAAPPLQSITLAGSAFVDRIEFRRPNGDWDELSLSEQSRSSAPLPEAEAKLLQMDGP
ncbi:MAG TPA: outer membrane lipoprotein carrier protein LolA [Stellaceae bacterium]|jgi:hypothetical protein|nr:outer membrane lipoprotein carrier protein LolA [Stellaceae bacterium]